MQDGLVCAFRYALAEYIPGRSQYAESPTGDFPVSEEARERVEEAASAVVDDPMSLMQFATGLSTGGYDPGRINFQELKQQVILALEEYYLLRESVMSPDPW
ncbi:hypothetical protein ACFVT6_28410 [Streptomyces sp. NPDC058049]|uniref:hypothetical protein n=1 Tax=Streptomyces sp. NPDC058049 TaxID=3346314 RepID=UPI0036E461E5